MEYSRRCNGGGICCTGSVLIEKNTIEKNNAYYGGGIFCYDSTGWIKFNTIRNNSSLSGGGIYCYESSLSIDGNVIKKNSSNGIGCVSYSCPSITNNIFYMNSAACGGGVYCRDYSSPEITNNSFYGNFSYSGGGIFCSENSSPVVTNTILWKNEDPEGFEIWIGMADEPSLLSISHSNLKGGQNSVYVCEGSTLNWGPEIIKTDPMFVDAPNEDFHLRLGSPCCDAGNNNAANLPDTDFEGDLRIVDGNWPQDGEARVDMGADELLPEIAVRFGTVNASGASLANILLMNGSIGDYKRIYTAPPGTSLTLSINAPPAGPNPAYFSLYVILYEPGIGDVAVQPFNLGLSCMPLPLSKGNPGYPPLTLLNTIGFYPSLGYPLLSGVTGAPLKIKNPAIPAGTYTFQGYIIDNGSSRHGLSLTNAIVVRVL